MSSPLPPVAVLVCEGNSKAILRAAWLGMHRTRSAVIMVRTGEQYQARVAQSARSVGPARYRDKAGCKRSIVSATAGLESRKEDSRMVLSMEAKADALIVTVNAFETKALLKAFKEVTGDSAQAISIDGRVYRYLGTLNGVAVFHALSEMGAGGRGGTQQSVDKGIRALRPNAVIAVGIAFGADQTKQRIGDILISRQLSLYESQRVGRSAIARGDRPHASPSLVNFLSGVAQTSWKGPNVSVGIMLSGEKLVDNNVFRKKLLRFEPEAIGGEMEGAGLYVASSEHKVEWIVVKAICDWADGNKDEKKSRRQALAAKNAAAFIVHSFLHVPFSGQRSLGRSRAKNRRDHRVRPADEHLRPAFQTLASGFEEYRAMLFSVRSAILNKLRFRNDSLEKRRVSVDRKIFASIPKVSPFIPAPFRAVIHRLRRITGCSWRDPLDVYYEMFEVLKVFPRGPVDGAGTLYNDLVSAFLEMTYLYFSGSVQPAGYAECLRTHQLDAQANTIRGGAVFRAARSAILEHELLGADENESALRAYADEIDSS
jgi:nucleoside phosphorylase